MSLNKLLATETNGRVLPILHLNGYKISAPAIAARKSERELKEMIRGFGYTPIVVNGEDMEQFQEALNSAVKNPFIIMKTEKGATGPAFANGKKVAGNYYAHQIPIKSPKTDAGELQMLQDWLSSYRFNELFDEQKGFMLQLTTQNLARTTARTTQSTQQTAKLVTQPTPQLDFPAELMGPGTIDHPGTETFSPAKKIGQLLKYTMEHDPSFYLFSPDETTSNKLDAAYDVTSRAWALPKKPWDMPESASGRIVELLSENTLFSVLTGHILGSQAQGMMTSYESFFEIVASQLIQYLKFLQQASEVSWREPIPALNLLSTSTCWRQDHNGFSHQSPALISALLSHPANRANCFFPTDDVSAAAIYNYMYNSQNVVNLTTFNKTDEPRWIDRNHAAFQLEHGASIFGFASDDNPDYIFTAAGDIMTREALAAIVILKQDLPGRRFRFVGISALSHGRVGTADHPMSQEIFNDYFTTDKPIIANFHGYPDDLKFILSQYTNPARIVTHGFVERGSTTTPFEMLSLNHASRYHLCLDIVSHENNQELIKKYQEIINQKSAHAREFGDDLD